MKITDIKFDQEITYNSEKIKHFDEIKEIFPIPNGSIIYKTTCGIGATHSEILAPRNSIIVMPHVSIVKNKHKSLEEDPQIDYNTFPVYGDITIEEVHKYLVKDDKVKKLLTTPKGLNKIIKAVNKTNRRFQDSFFLLVDECHKLIKDANYRTDMVDMMDNFFAFNAKAMVSATPIPPSDARFTDNNFRLIKVSPENLKRTPISLINTNNIFNGLKNYINHNSNDRYFIFFDSIKGITTAITELKLSEEAKIFCSSESRKDLAGTAYTNVSDVYEAPDKYNFFTSSFFNGLDILVEGDIKPDIIMISDCAFQDHTLIDPFTDSTQIIGRIRDSIETCQETGKYTRIKNYRNIVHINNAYRWLTPLNEVELAKSISDSKASYEMLLGLENAFIGKGIYPFLLDALKETRPHFNLLNKKGNYSSYLYDNYINENRVKQYYKGSDTLKSAYASTTLFSLFPGKMKFDKKDQIKSNGESFRNTKTNIQRVAQQLNDLEALKGCNQYYYTREQIKSRNPMVFEAYELLKYEGIKICNFNRREIEKALFDFKFEDGRDSYPIKTLVYRYYFYIN
ncbi:MAG: hypothetical protein EOO43_02425, partial [Flavobacterium sp.]